jgi:hypothetical protein
MLTLLAYDPHEDKLALRVRGKSPVYLILHDESHTELVRIYNGAQHRSLETNSLHPHSHRAAYAATVDVKAAMESRHFDPRNTQTTLVLGSTTIDAAMSNRKLPQLLDVLANAESQPRNPAREIIGLAQPMAAPDNQTAIVIPLQRDKGHPFLAAMAESEPHHLGEVADIAIASVVHAAETLRDGLEQPFHDARLEDNNLSDDSLGHYTAALDAEKAKHQRSR